MECFVHIFFNHTYSSQSYAVVFQWWILGGSFRGHWLNALLLWEKFLFGPSTRNILFSASNHLIYIIKTLTYVVDLPV